MVVINIVGFPYKVKLKDGRTVILPNDNIPHTVPDELLDLFTSKNYDNVFRVLVPPMPKVIVQQPMVEKSEIIEINLDDEIIIEEKPVEKKAEEKPLKGKKIKIKKRKALIKKRIKEE